MSILPSTRFGGWTKTCNGVEQHGMSKKDLVNHFLQESAQIKKRMSKKQRRVVKRLAENVLTNCNKPRFGIRTAVVTKSLSKN